MPTTARLVAAVIYAALLGYISYITFPMFEGMQIPRFYHEINIGVGAAMGWNIAGPRAGTGYPAAVSYGLTTLVAICFWALLIHGVLQMWKFAHEAGHYDGPLEALIDALKIGVEIGTKVAAPHVMVALLVGGVVAGVLTEFVGRRWS